MREQGGYVVRAGVHLYVHMYIHVYVCIYVICMYICDQIRGNCLIASLVKIDFFPQKRHLLSLSIACAKYERFS